MRKWKKIFSKLLLFFFCSCGQISYAQDSPFVIQNVKIKKGTDSSVLHQLESFMKDVIRLNSTDREGIYSGSIENISYTRKGNIKACFSIDYKVQPIIETGKISLNFWIIGAKMSSTLCDKTQKLTSSPISISEIPSKLRDEFIVITEKFSDYLKEYIKNGETKGILYLTTRPYWYNLNYIVESNSVSYFKVLHSRMNLSKEELYKVLENYFTYAYGSGKAVVENKNPQDGTIIAKGIYGNIHEYSNSFVGCIEDYDIKHVVSIQCRDGRVRVTITIGNYDIHRKGKQWDSYSDYTRNITAYEPFGKEHDEEMDECLMKLEYHIITQFNEMQKAIDEGNTAVEAIDDW